MSILIKQKKLKIISNIYQIDCPDRDGDIKFNSTLCLLKEYTIELNYKLLLTMTTNDLIGLELQIVEFYILSCFQVLFEYHARFYFQVY